VKQGLLEILTAISFHPRHSCRVFASQLVKLQANTFMDEQIKELTTAK
jgi:hypothetical protein